MKTYPVVLTIAGSDSGLFERVFKRVQIHNNQVYRRDIVLFCLRYILLIFTSIQNSAHDNRVKRFHSSAKNGGIGCKTFYGCCGDSCFLKIIIGSPRRKNLNIQPLQLFCNNIQLFLIENRN